MTAPSTFAQPVHGSLEMTRRLFLVARPPIVRTMRQFAEDEIIVPSGIHAGRHFSTDYQPCSRLWLDEIDSGFFRRFAATGPTQSGKTLTCFIIPILYHLFEVGERVVVGIPDLDMMKDKWELEIKPVIESGQYARYLPTSGAGSKGGMGTLLKFKNGSALRFMTGGAGDKGRSAFTAKIVVVTEANAFGVSSETSEEADQIKQLEARTRHFGSDARIYMECTQTTKEGKIYREIHAGTRSRIVLLCPHCKSAVSPEREHLKGWEKATTIREARAFAEFCCPECGAAWTERQRVSANMKARLVHDNPLAMDGNTLGFRWSAVNNLFLTAADLGEDEFDARMEDDEENAEKELCQFVWAIPYRPPEMDVTPLDARTMERRGDTGGATVKNEAPEWAEFITIGIDLGKRFGSYVVLAWKHDATSRMIDYGTFEVPGDSMDTAIATLAALRDFRDRVAMGWNKGSRKITPACVLIDCNYSDSRQAVYRFCQEQAEHEWIFHPALGVGSWHNRRTYTPPAQQGRTKRGLSDHYHKEHLHNRLWEIRMDSNHWKSFVHERIHTPPDAAGSMTFYYSPDKNEHSKLVKHLTAERAVQGVAPDGNPVVKWENKHKRQNHYFDCTYMASVAAHLVGVRLMSAGKAPATARNWFGNRSKSRR